MLHVDNISMNTKVKTRDEAIRLAGHLLVKNSYVTQGYIAKMLEREEISSTYIGNKIAIPHGTEEAKKEVSTSGITILQLQNEVDFGDGNLVKIVIGIAGKDNEHLDILSKIAVICSNDKNVEKLIHAESKEQLLAILAEVN